MEVPPHTHPSPGTALRRIKRVLSAYRRPNPPPPPQPCATGEAPQPLPATSHSHTRSLLDDALKIGYLMLCNSQLGSSTFDVELCALTRDGSFVRIGEKGAWHSVVFTLAETARRLTDPAARGRRAIEVIGLESDGPLVLLLATSKSETRAWLSAMRGWPLAPMAIYPPAAPASPASSDIWDVVDIGGRQHGRQGQWPLRISTLLLAAQLRKPPRLVQALVRALVRALHSAAPDRTPFALRAVRRVKHRPALFSTAARPAPFVLAMNPSLSGDPDVCVLLATVLYLRMLDVNGAMRPAPHALAPGAVWQPYIGVLAQCADCVTLFLFDIDGSLAVEVAEIDVAMLSTQGIQTTNDSVFDDVLAFRIDLDEAFAASQRNEVFSVTKRRRARRRASMDSVLGRPSGRSAPSKNPEGYRIGGGLAASRSKSNGRARRCSADAQLYGQLQELRSRAGSDGPEGVFGSADLPATLYLAAPCASERTRWVGLLRQYAKPPLTIAIAPQLFTFAEASLAFRVERCLWIRVLGAQGLSRPCDITAMVLADGNLIAQTDTAVDTRGPRWESSSFCFGSLEPIRRGLHVLVRQSVRQRGTVVDKDSSSCAGVVGYCQIPLSTLRHGHSYDGWYPLSYGDTAAVSECLETHLPLAPDVKPALGRGLSIRRLRRSRSAKAATRTDTEEQPPQELPVSVAGTSKQPSIPFRSGDVHIQVCYDETIVLRHPLYDKVTALLLDTDPTLVVKLAGTLPMSADWLVETATKVAMHSRRAEGWIEVLVCHELAAQAERDPALLFRGSSAATRAIDTLMKIAGLEFVDQLIGNVVRSVIGNGYECEVDPSRLAADESVDIHWQALTRLLDALWRGIEEGASACPPIIRRVFACIRSSTAAFYDHSESYPQVRYSCISSFVFLRLLCPAMLSPKAFGLVSRPPPASTLRTLTLLAKGIQCAANLSDFSSKEPYMQPMNEFVRGCIPKLKRFIDDIALAQSPEDRTTDGVTNQGNAGSNDGVTNQGNAGSIDGVTNQGRAGSTDGARDQSSMGSTDGAKDQGGVDSTDGTRDQGGVCAVDGEYGLAVFCDFIYTSREAIRSECRAQQTTRGTAQGSEPANVGLNIVSGTRLPQPPESERQQVSLPPHRATGA
ncbi:GTPase activating factor [Coemansia sp. RSA 552]|nr:GTPase activating factor [Coemansia sp. RSA 552]